MFLKFFRVILIGLAGLVFLAAIIFFIFPLPGQIPVLMYHVIGSEAEAHTSGNVVTQQTFEKQMAFLKFWGYHVISLDDFAATRLGTRKAHGREIVLTFDDGNPSVFQQAWPILKKHHFPSTQFLISEGLKTGTYGSVASADIQDLTSEPLLIWGSHSRTHPFLSQISDTELLSEIGESKTDLEKSLNIKVSYFAYPNGDFDLRCIQAVEKAGYKLAFTTSPKKLKGFQAGDYAIPRVKISENAGNLIIFWVKISGIYESFKMWRHKLYQGKMAASRHPPRTLL